MLVQVPNERLHHYTLQNLATNTEKLLLPATALHSLLPLPFASANVLYCTVLYCIVLLHKIGKELIYSMVFEAAKK